ncbi:MAG: methenyltetrahydromethanopterin cyclohydrolase [Leptothrix sp. (in: b-proteobacteria)]
MTAARPPLADSPLRINALAAPLVRQLLERADALGLGVTHTEAGVTLVDGGIAVPGSVEAGRLIGEICMGGLGTVRQSVGLRAGWPVWLEVVSAQPVLACLGSQYAGWSLAASKEEGGGKSFFSLGSGPARALAGKEALFAELGYSDRRGLVADQRSTSGVLVLEVDRPPPPVVIDKVLRNCALPPDGLTLIMTPTRSLAGTTQVVARVLEVALHKAHTLGFDLNHIVDGSAAAPLPSPVADGVRAMGRTNDAILYGGQVRLVVSGPVEAARDLARRLPSINSRDHGRPFAEVFKAAECDFYRIDPLLFAPAEAWVSHLDSGTTFHAGALHMDLLLADWLQPAAIDIETDAPAPSADAGA